MQKHVIAFVPLVDDQSTASEASKTAYLNKFERSQEI